jgi:hypothetical protein
MGRHQIITWMKHIFKYHPNGLLWYHGWNIELDFGSNLKPMT